MIERGASHDFPEYRPHISLVKDPDADLKPEKITPYAGMIRLGPEIFEPLKGMDERAEKNIAAFKVEKVDEALGLVFGWGIICKENGADYVDVQDHHIPESAMVRATTNFMESARIAKDMHKGPAIGGVVHSFPLTTDVAKAMGIKTKKTGWMVAMKPSPPVLKKYASGEYTGFSIGGFYETDDE